jgi:hypothetical protein
VSEPKETIDELYSRERQNEQFAMLVAARVNDIRSGEAKPLHYELPTGASYTREQEVLLFADLIARAVCSTLE